MIFNIFANQMSKVRITEPDARSPEPEADSEGEEGEEAVVVGELAGYSGTVFL